MQSPPIYAGRCLSIHTITKQAAEFCAGFDQRELRDFEVAATLLDRSAEIGRPPGGRSERIRGTKHGIFELRVTPPGRRGPHTRLLYIREGSELLILRGVRKAQRGIPRRQIEIAEHLVAEWREGHDDAEGDGKEQGGAA